MVQTYIFILRTNTRHAKFLLFDCILNYWTMEVLLLKSGICNQCGGRYECVFPVHFLEIKSRQKPFHRSPGQQENGSWLIGPPTNPKIYCSTGPLLPSVCLFWPESVLKSHAYMRYITTQFYFLRTI